MSFPCLDWQGIFLQILIKSPEELGYFGLVPTLS